MILQHTCNYYSYYDWEVNDISTEGMELTSLMGIHEATSLCEISHSIYGGLILVYLTIAHKVSRVWGPGISTTDIPSGDIQVALILSAGTYPGLHLKTI